MGACRVAVAQPPGGQSLIQPAGTKTPPGPCRVPASPPKCHAGAATRLIGPSPRSVIRPTPRPAYRGLARHGTPLRRRARPCRRVLPRCALLRLAAACPRHSALHVPRATAREIQDGKTETLVARCRLAAHQPFPAPCFFAIGGQPISGFLAFDGRLLRCRRHEPFAISPTHSETPAPLRHRRRAGPPRAIRSDTGRRDPSLTRRAGDRIAVP